MKASTRWPLGITLILVSFAGANIYMMRVANDDPAFAVEPNYYRKAVDFDSTMARERRSLALGWVASSTIERREGATTVAVTLRDSAGQPIRGAKVSIDARFNARANDVLTAALSEQAPGVYEGPLAATRAGAWEVRVDATRGDAHFSASTRTDARTGK